MFAWFVLVLCFALLLMLGINWLLRRLGIAPVEETRREGLADVAGRLERWAEARKGTRKR